MNIRTLNEIVERVSKETQSAPDVMDGMEILSGVIFDEEHGVIDTGFLVGTTSSGTVAVAACKLIHGIIIDSSLQLTLFNIDCCGWSDSYYRLGYSYGIAERDMRGALDRAFVFNANNHGL